MPEEKCVKPLIQLRDVEKRVRNVAAHTIVPINKRFITRESGYSPHEIWDLFKDAVSAILSRQPVWNSYDLMNDHIRETLMER